MANLRRSLGTKIFKIQNATPADNPELDISKLSGDTDPHTLMLGKLAELSKGQPQKNLSQVIINNVTRKKRVAMILAPFWSVHIAPYAIARLVALAKHAGFASCAYDLNVICHHAAKEFWSPYLDWKWDQDVYWTDIHPVIEPILLEQIEKIVEFRPDVAGLSLYYTNENCASWVIKELRKRLPGIKILGGGSQAVQNHVRYTDLFDHIVSGEGEILFLQLLENIESGSEPMPKMLFHPKSQRIDLDSMPWPDYSDLPLDLYELGTAVGSEISRGCIAKCQFCSETTFWRYRGRLATNIVDEIEYQYRTFNVRAVWFIDSLVNGNLKELRAFALGVVAKGMHDLQWVGYCRCDARMDLEYFRDLKNSGCMYLSFGIESGSQKVLNLMKKNVKVEAVEQNLKDLTEVNIGALTNWFVGFPGEQPIDVAHTFTLIWRTRLTNVINYGVQNCYVLDDTPLYHERDKFGICTTHFGGQWVTKDYQNTVLHRLVRLKCVNIILNHMRRGTDKHKLERPGVENHYDLKYENHDPKTFIPYDHDFDYDILQLDINPVANSLVNEIWPLFRILWLALGSFEITVNFDHDVDKSEWGYTRMPTDESLTKMNASIYFNISPDGDFVSRHCYDVVAPSAEENYHANNLDYSFHLDREFTGKW